MIDGVVEMLANMVDIIHVLIVTIQDIFLHTNGKIVSQYIIEFKDNTSNSFSLVDR